MYIYIHTRLYLRHAAISICRHICMYIYTHTHTHTYTFLYAYIENNKKIVKKKIKNLPARHWANSLASELVHHLLARRERACTTLSAYVSIRQHSSAYVSIRQYTSVYVSIRQHTSAYVRRRTKARSLPTRSRNTGYIYIYIYIDI